MKNANNASRPSLARGSKHHMANTLTSLIPVAPFTGAWIETRALPVVAVTACWSRPSRARGSKLEVIEKHEVMTPCRALAGGMAPDCGNPQLFIEKKLPIVKREGRRRSRIATALENARGGRNLYAAYMRSVSPGPRIPTAGGVPICPPQQAASREARYMGDLLYLGLGVAGFALMLLYVRACQKL